MSACNHNYLHLMPFASSGKITGVFFPTKWTFWLAGSMFHIVPLNFSIVVYLLFSIVKHCSRLLVSSSSIGVVLYLFHIFRTLKIRRVTKELQNSISTYSMWTFTLISGQPFCHLKLTVHFIKYPLYSACYYKQNLKATVLQDCLYVCCGYTELLLMTSFQVVYWEILNRTIPLDRIILKNCYLCL